MYLDRLSLVDSTFIGCQLHHLSSHPNDLVGHCFLDHGERCGKCARRSLGWSQLYAGRDSFVESLQHSICEWDPPWTFEKRWIGRGFFIFLPIRFVKLSCFLWVLHLGPRFVIRTLDIGSLDWWSLMIMTCSNTSERLGYWTIKICPEVPGKFSQLLPVYCANKPLQLFILANNELNELLFAHQPSVVLVQN